MTNRPHFAFLGSGGVPIKTPLLVPMVPNDCLPWPWGALPVAVGSMLNLYHVDVSRNRIKGTLPACLSSLASKLNLLSLWDNQLAGRLGRENITNPIRKYWGRHRVSVSVTILAWLPVQSLAEWKKPFFGADFGLWKTFKLVEKCRWNIFKWPERGWKCFRVDFPTQFFTACADFAGILSWILLWSGQEVCFGPPRPILEGTRNARDQDGPGSPPPRDLDGSEML